MAGCRPIDQKTELPRMLAAMRGFYALRDRALLIVGVRTGFRIGELLSLRLADVIQDGRFVRRIVIRRRHLKGGKKKGSKVESREVPTHEEIRRAVRPWLLRLRELGYMQGDDFLFQSRQGRNRAISVQRAWSIFTRAARAAGLTGSVGTHSARKTFANIMHVKLGGDLFKISKAMGHKDPKSTAAYLSFKREEIDAAILNAEAS